MKIRSDTRRPGARTGLATAMGSLVLIVVGIMFIVLGYGALVWMMTGVGILLAATGLLYILRSAGTRSSGDAIIGVVGLVLGLILALSAGLWSSLLMVILGALLAIGGLFCILGSGLGFIPGSRLATIVIGAAMLVLGTFTVLDPGGAASVLMTAIGILAVSAGLLGLFRAHNIGFR